MTGRSARLVPALLVTIMGASVATRQLSPGFVDPGPVLDAAAKTIGTANLRCVTISGTAYAGAVGQQRESARNVDWPRVREVFNYTPRTLRPDMVSLWPPTELAEGYFYEAIRENFIISDGTRNLNVHYVNPLQHADGMLIAYLPRERLLFEADLLDTNQPRRATPTSDQVSFFNAVRKLGLDPLQVVPVHGRPERWATIQ